MTAPVPARTGPDDPERAVTSAPAHAQAPLPSVLREGAGVLRDTGRLLAAYWPMLLAVACTATVARALLLQLAIVASRSWAILVELVQALVPFAQILAVVVMLLLMRGAHAPTSGAPLDVSGDATAAARPSVAARAARALSALVVAASAVLIPFLVIYEHDGTLTEERFTIGYALVGDLDIDNGERIASRLSLSATTSVVVTVAVALLARRVLTGLVRRTPPGHDGRRAALRLAAGYCEAIWIVLGALVVSQSLGSASQWWHSRVAGAAVDAWWQGVSASLPHLAGGVDALLAGAALLVGAAVTAIIIPLAWLNLAAVVYGVEASKVLTARDLATGRRAGAVVARVGDERTDRALALLTDPERRFGAVIGAAGLIARAGWRPVLVVCLAFTVTNNADLLVWELARVVVGPQTFVAWDGLSSVLDAVGQVVDRVLTLALVAAAANAIMVRLGLPDALRLPDARRGQSTGNAA